MLAIPIYILILYAHDVAYTISRKSLTPTTMVTVAVVAAGAMGSAIGRRLSQHGCTVLTILEGRSDASRRRAADCGMEDVTFSYITEHADYLLSILPPSHAYSFAEHFLHKQTSTAGGLKRDKQDGLIFVDCNAVNPVTVKRIGDLFTGESTRFIDAGIIGGPPFEEYDPTIYASASDKDALEKFGYLSQYGLKISLIRGGNGVGDASALKMSYAGMTKGTTALYVTMILAAQASSPATTEALLHELRASQPEFLKRISRAIPSMLPKAYRWVGEMEEIAGFIESPERETYRGIAKLYQRIERSLEEEEAAGDIAVLKRFAEAASR
ncbi:hypothetical protein E1B28_010007 [Marasmius oreades]|uniref:Phosphogluconate dehydrogenase NAD-binding putative C-terminal domain-containing protein n=1 Tax=Marasmius oreades TaxID=181124 RepID=A0A9P7UT75_9AGAR|nr:uncharacterized protein E1B28_010007 [Marasmius oreades]KAG7090934.1 hypothetical protein E1B28_010007 [Marasmius oreades]